MRGDAWKDELRRHFESVKLIEKAKADTLESFSQFCEFIAEPAFESLQEEMKEYGIKVRLHEGKGSAVGFELSFAGSNTDQFHYRIVLPKNSYELKLGLVLRGRRSKSAPLVETVLEFMSGRTPAEIMRVSKEDLLRDVVERYRDFALTAMTSPD